MSQNARAERWLPSAGHVPEVPNGVTFPAFRGTPRPAAGLSVMGRMIGTFDARLQAHTTVGVVAAGERGWRLPDRGSGRCYVKSVPSWQKHRSFPHGSTT
jgi:hypothetical protein